MAAPIQGSSPQVSISKEPLKETVGPLASPPETTLKGSSDPIKGIGSESRSGNNQYAQLVAETSALEHKLKGIYGAKWPHISAALAVSIADTPLERSGPFSSYASLGGLHSLRAPSAAITSSLSNIESQPPVLGKRNLENSSINSPDQVSDVSLGSSRKGRKLDQASEINGADKNVIRKANKFIAVAKGVFEQALLKESVMKVLLETPVDSQQAYQNRQQAVRHDSSAVYAYTPEEMFSLGALRA